ncbi:unnamed protein product [Caenorhabditis angaria]|uniref:Anaphase-promoting complex subunit 11 n=1 Tax=Caenorhabditis angaria TaxID=860376 RepID=A0A9P1N5I2_9PELO|nr:unnamed protein product [Caenorhabditis angaria]
MSDEDEHIVIDIEDDDDDDDVIIVPREEKEPTPMVESAPVELPTQTRLKITVKKLHVTAKWKWCDVGEDTCGICRMEFEATCNSCKMPGDDCPLEVGVCRHAFHRHCIERWTEGASSSQNGGAKNGHCPLCRQEWKVSLRNRVAKKKKRQQTT